MVARRGPDEPTLPFEEPTSSISEVCAEIRETLRSAPARWVVGEIQRLRKSRPGHLYLELVEKGDGDQVVAKLESVLWRRDAERVERQLRQAGRELTDGLEVRCRGSIDFYPPFGRLQLVVREVDTVFLLGELTRRRQETIAALVQRGLFDRNRELELTPVPLDVALVTSEGSAAYHDFLSSLSASTFGFRVLFVHAAVQGRTAERELTSALKTAGALGADCTVLIRGGGSKTDLAAFDSRRLAEAIALSPVPVITGLGHETDLSIADQVSHTRTKTPTQAAELLVQRVEASNRQVVETARRLHHDAEGLVRESKLRWDRVAAGLRMAAYTLQTQQNRFAGVWGRLATAASLQLRRAGRVRTSLVGRFERSAPRIVRRREADVARVVEGAARAVGTRLENARLGLEASRRLCAQMSPARSLARGFSITRDVHGRVVRARDQVQSGDRIVSELADGKVISRVEE